jgi:hypothetical protein
VRDKLWRRETAGQVRNQVLEDCAVRLSRNQPDSGPGQKTIIFIQFSLLTEKLPARTGQGLQRFENSLE